ncbi:MAG: peptidase U32 family protein [Fusobacteriaceae bacterium]
MLIVAPAGDIEKFYAAVDAGADEVYMGLQGFGARKSAKNFTMSEYKASIDYAHERGSRVLLTLNTVMMDNEIESLYHNLKVLYETGLDAVIVQDLGMFKFLKENFPKLEIHASTQMTVSNHVEAQYLKDLGFSRVVPSRELTLEDIKKIKENCDIELEIFVSGALCVSYSGKCYISSFIGARSGNRGMCAQPCRKVYQSSNGETGYLISPKDQLMGKEEIDALKEIGVESIKIEGRMKDANYVHELTSYYRKLIGGENSKTRVENVFNRGYSKGYFYGEKEEILNRDYSFNLGKKLGVFSGKEIILSEEVRFGDGVTFVSKNYEKLGGTYINRLNIKGDENPKSEKAEKGSTLIIRDIPIGTRYLYKSYSKDIMDEISSEMKNTDKRVLISGEFVAKIGELPKLKLKYKNLLGKEVNYELKGEKIVEKASKRALTHEEILEKISEMGDTTFYLNKEDFKISIDSEIFIPVSILKSLRRDCAEELIDLIVESYKREINEEIKLDEKIEGTEKDQIIISAIVENQEQEKRVKELGIEKVYYSNINPVREENIDKVKYKSSLAYSMLDLKRNPSKNLTTHWCMNITNRHALEVLSKDKKIETVILSPELSFEKIKNLGNTKLKKALLIYSKAKVMHLELPAFKKDSSIINDKGDIFNVIINEYGNSEIYLDKPLNITDRMKEVRSLGVDEVVLEFKKESLEEIESIIKGISETKNSEKENLGYNYWKGVY